MPKMELQQFLESLATRGQLLRIGKPVSADLEIAEITRRVAATGGPALLFDQVEGSAWPVVTNLLGTIERLTLGLQIDVLESLTEVGRAAMIDCAQHQGKRPVSDPRIAKQASSQQVVRLGRDIDLTTLPALRCWPDETGPTLWGRLFHKAENGATSSFLCRAQILDRNQLALVDDGWPDPNRSLADSLGAGSKVSVAFVPGGSASELLLAASALADYAPSLTEKLNQGQMQEVTPARSCELLVPAAAQVVIEGTIEQQPSGQVVRAASLSGSQYVFDTSPIIVKVTVITHRASPIVMNIVDGPALGNDDSGDFGVLHKAVERLSLPFLQQAIRNVVDIAMPFVGAWQKCCILAIKKVSPGEARRAANAVWGLPWATRVKLLIIVDAETQLHHWPSVLSAITTNVDFAQDVMHNDGPAQITDYALGCASLRRTIAIDATTKLPGEGRTAWPPQMIPSAEIAEQVTRRWTELGLPPLARSNAR